MPDSASQTLEQGESLDALGQVWRFAAVTQRRKAEFESYCRLQARRAIFADKVGLSPDAYQDAQAALNRSIAAGEYSWGFRMGPAVKAALLSDPGLLHLAGLLLRPNHPHITEEQVEALAREDDEMFGWVMWQSILPDPNRKRPARKTPTPAETKTATKTE